MLKVTRDEMKVSKHYLKPSISDFENENEASVLECAFISES